MLVKMRILITAFQQVAMLMLNFSHDFHSSPFVHFAGQIVLVGKVVSIFLFILKRILVELASDCLSTNIGPDCSFVMDEAFNDWNDMCILRPDIDDQTTFEGK